MLPSVQIRLAFKSELELGLGSALRVVLGLRPLWAIGYPSAKLSQRVAVQGARGVWESAPPAAGLLGRERPGGDPGKHDRPFARHDVAVVVLFQVCPHSQLSHIPGHLSPHMPRAPHQMRVRGRCDGHVSLTLLGHLGFHHQPLHMHALHMDAHLISDGRPCFGCAFDE